MSSRTLSLSLRPRTFEDMFGQEKITNAIRMQMKKREPNAWLFAGETGSGKTTISRIIGTSLNCTHQKKFGSPCKDCSKNWQQLMSEIPVAQFGGIDAVKDFAAGSDYAPIPPLRRRVYILDEAQRLSKAAQSLLLKYVEDAPRSTSWLLATTDPEDILPALRGRCHCYHMTPLRGRLAEDFIKWAAKQGNVNRDLTLFIDYVHTKDVTSARNLLTALEKYGAGLDPDAAVAGAESNVDTKRICQQLLNGEWNFVRQELEKATPSDARLVRSAVLGYLRAVLLNKKSNIKPSIVAQAIKDIAGTSYMDDATQHAVLAAVLYQVCQKLGTAVK